MMGVRFPPPAFLLLVPDENILFEDSQAAILIQHRQEVARVSMKDVEAIDRLLNEAGENVMVQSTLLEKLEKLPAQLQTEVLHYIEFPLEKHTKNELQHPNQLQESLQSLTDKEAEKRSGYGSMAGQIVK
jgi:hypothetical protein